MSDPKRTAVTDSLGRVTGYITEDDFGQKHVTDSLGKSLGHSDERGTHSFLGKTVSRSDNPGMLFDEDEEDDE